MMTGRIDLRNFARTLAVSAALTLSFAPISQAADREGDPSSGMTKRMTGTSTDMNGDGKRNNADAFFITILSGGTHEAEIEISSMGSTSVTRGGSATSSSSNSSTTTVSGGASFAGAGFSASKSVSKEVAEQIKKEFSDEKGESKEVSATATMSAKEYETKCSYLFGVFNTYEVETWESVPLSGDNSLSSKIQSQIKTAYKNTAAAGAWKYFDYKSGTIVTGRPIQGSTTVAYREQGGVGEAQQRTEKYEVTRLEDFQSSACTVADLQGRAKEATKGQTTSGGLQGAMRNKFKFEAKGDAAAGEPDWGVYTQSKIKFRVDQECGNESTGWEKFTYWRKKSKGQSQGSSQSTTTTGSVSFGMEASSGQGSAKAGVSQEEKDSDAKTKEEFENQGKEKVMSVRVGWKIVNAHAHHWSDHMIAPMDYKGGSSGAGAGLLVLRYAERSCLTPGEPENPETPGTDPPRPTFTPSPNVTPPAPDRKSVDDPPTGSTSTGGDIDVPTDDATPEGESTQEPGAPPDDRTQADMDTPPTHSDVKFKSLAGQTNVNAERTGTPVTVTASDLDGKPVPVEVETDERTVKIIARAPANPANIKVVGHRGTTILRSNFIPEAATPTPLSPSDGIVETVNGTVNETLSTPSGTTNMTAPPASHTVTFGETPVDVVATRPNEIAVTGSDVSAGSSGSVLVTLTSPTGDTVSGSVPAWGYRLGASPVTQVNTWAPIYFQCTGLDDQDIIDIKFVPTSGQIIKPSQVAVTCGSATDIAEIAQYQTPQVGPQVFNALVQRRADN